MTPRAQVVPPDVLELLRRLRDAGHRSFLAGGCVRDACRDVPPSDFDVATPALPEAVLRLFPRANPTGLKHGTVTVPTDAIDPDTGLPRQVEVTTFRGDGTYVDGRHPDSVRFLADVHEDLARRDFTINALAWDPLDGTLVDPFDGQGDLDRRLVRAVREPYARFHEDGLRSLRGVRFASTFAFELEPATKAAIEPTLDVFAKVAFERVRDELTKLLLNSPRPSVGLQLLVDTGLMRRIAPELLESVGVPQNRWHAYDVWTHVLAVVDAAPPRLVVRLAALLHDVAKPRTAVEKPDGDRSFHGHEHLGATLTRDMLERLKFPRSVIDAVVLQVAQHQWHYTPEWSDAAVRRHLAQVGRDALPDFFDLRAADIRGRGKGVEEGLAELEHLRGRIEVELSRSNALTVRDLALPGGEIMAIAGRGPGPHVGVIQKRLLAHLMETPDDNTAERLASLVRAWSNDA